ncbi:MAG: thiamine-monophosphate kinase [Promethearchaeota archaeon]
MNKNLQIGNLGENKLIKLIEDLILKKTGKVLLRDDSFFFNPKSRNLHDKLVLNSDMLVFTTDVPPLMNYYQTGKKSVIMNISDLIVKGVEPRGIIMSLGLPKELKKEEFIDIINGIIDCSMKFNLGYIGGDINETKELIINPTVFGFKNPSDIIFRNGMKIDDILVVNNKFGLTGVGFDILLNKNGDLESFPDYKRSIMSVLEPDSSGREALILSEKKLATSSIDSSDGLSKSLRDLILSNPNLGFEITFNDNLIDQEALKYSQEFNLPLEDLVFNGGEEFIHLFTITERNFSKAKKEMQTRGGKLFRIGKVISGEYIYILEENKRSELKSYGFEHFNKSA